MQETIEINDNSDTQLDASEIAETSLESNADDLKLDEEPSENHYGYWAYGRDMYDMNLTDLQQNGVTDILLNYYVYTKYNQNEVESFVASANEKGIHTHIWAQIFYDGTWTRPVDSQGNWNYDFFDEKIAELEMYANTTGVYGVHYDYLRFSGSAYYNNTAEQNPGGIEAISYFVETSCAALRKINPDIFISVAIMPEIDVLETWYGYNYTVISSCMNASLPMIYTSNFRQNATWVKETTKWFVDNSKGAEVWTGLQGYTVNDYYEDVIFESPISQVNIEIKSALDGGSNGAIIFKFGKSGNIDFNNLSVCEAELDSFKNLNYVISTSRNNVILDRDFAFNETYDGAFKDGIPLLRNDLIIDGANHIIDGRNLSKIFNVEGKNITFKNIIFKNGFADNGSTISIKGENNTIMNSEFINCNGNENGGAIYWHGLNGVVFNCIFRNNTANHGGAIHWYSNDGTVSNCTFINNLGNISGGAIFWDSNNGVISNCNFINNSAEGGGALLYYGNYGSLSNCNFTNNIAVNSRYGGGAVLWSGHYASMYNNTFVNNTGSKGGSVVLDGASYASISNCNFINNTAQEYCAAILFDSGILNSVSNCNFINNTAETGGTGVYLYNTYYSSVSDCKFINNFAGYDGSAIYVDPGDYCTVSNSTFINNTCSYSGGVISWYGHNGTVFNCNFMNNKAVNEGGAIYWFFNDGLISNCNFTNNTANKGGAIYTKCPVINCIFTNNTANEGGAIYKGIAVLCTFNCDSDNCFETEIVPANITVCDFISTYNSGAKLLFNITADIEINEEIRHFKIDGINTTIKVYQNDNLIGAYYAISGDGWIVNLNPGVYTAVLSLDKYSEVKAVNASMTVRTITPTTIITSPVNTTYNSDDKLIITLKDDLGNPIANTSMFVYITELENYTTDSNGQVNVSLKGLDANTYEALIIALGNENYTGSSASEQIIINPQPCQLTANAVSTTYNVNKDLVITLKDKNGNALSGVQITVNLGSDVKYTTDKNGQVKVNVAKLVPKTYNAKISVENNNYKASPVSVKVTVKKATPKITAKAKTFKLKVKTKKYAVTFKDNKGKAIKKAKLTLKVKGKTYKATTNAKGKAIFKIKKLTKKGKFKAKIGFKGDKFYKAVSKNVKITIK